MTIDWSQAPAWAQYHVFDSDGRGWWYEVLPYIVDEWWCVANTRIEWLISGYTLPAGQDWRQSLVEKAKEEVK